jgi:hypothetical protein
MPRLGIALPLQGGVRIKSRVEGLQTFRTTLCTSVHLLKRDLGETASATNRRGCGASVFRQGRGVKRNSVAGGLQGV